MVLRNHQLLALFISLMALVLTACEDDAETATEPSGIQATLKAPTLERRGIPQTNSISMAALVDEDQMDGTIHYLYFTESDHEGEPTPQELLDHRLTQTIDMSGSTIKLFNFSASQGTTYYIYALLKVEDEVSEVILLEAATAD